MQRTKLQHGCIQLCWLWNWRQKKFTLQMVQSHHTILNGIIHLTSTIVSLWIIIYDTSKTEYQNIYLSFMGVIFFRIFYFFVIFTCFQYSYLAFMCLFSIHKSRAVVLSANLITSKYWGYSESIAKFPSPSLRSR